MNARLSSIVFAVSIVLLAGAIDARAMRANTKHYVDPSKSLEFDYPNTWVANNTTEKDVIFRLFPGANDRDPVVVTTLHKLPADAPQFSRDELQAGILQSMHEEKLPNAQIADSKDATIGGVAGGRFVIDATVEPKNLPIKVIVVVWVHGGNICSMGLVGKPDNVALFESDFDDLVKTIHFPAAEKK